MVGRGLQLQVPGSNGALRMDRGPVWGLTSREVCGHGRDSFARLGSAVGRWLPPKFVAGDLLRPPVILLQREIS